MYAGPSCVRVASVTTDAPLALASATGTGVGSGVCGVGNESVADAAAVGAALSEAAGDGAELLPAQLESTIDDATASAARRIMAVGPYVTPPRGRHCGKHLNLRRRGAPIRVLYDPCRDLRSRPETELVEDVFDVRLDRPLA